MTVIKNVVHVGAAGSLGEPVLKALVDSGKFNITVFVRSTTQATFPSSVKTVTVDYDSLESLTNALKGQDAVISTVGFAGTQGQILIIDAAIAAGVKRFIPSEFGSDLDNPKTARFPVYAYKAAVNKYIREKASANPDFTYTLVRNGVFLDWGLQQNFILDLQSGSPRIFNGGDRTFSTTNLDSVGQAVIGVLQHPEETRNRPVYVEDGQITQNKVLALAKKIAPEKKWEAVPSSTEEILKNANEAIVKGDFSLPVLYEFIYVSVFGEGYGGLMTKNDNALLGIAGNKTDADIEAILKPLLN